MKYLLFKGLGPDDLPTLKQLTTKEIWKVWAGTSKHIRKQLLEKKAVDIGIGTFALVPVHVMVGEDKVLPVERPVFQLCRLMKKFYKLKCAKTKIPKETPFVQLDFEQIGADIHFRREIVEQCIHETLLFFAAAIRDKREVEFSFRSVGILAVRRSVVSMTFFDDCLLELDATGNMQAALLGNPKMMRIVAFAGKNDYSRLSQDGVIVLPRLVVIAHQALGHIVSLKPRRESAPWGEGARRVSVLDPVFLAQRRVSLARLKDREVERIKAIEASRARFTPVIKETSQGGLKQPRPAARPPMQVPEYALQPSGTEMSSVHAERAAKQLWLEFKRQQVEAEVWRKYHASRTGQSTEPGKSPCRHRFEDSYCPPHLLRKAYAEKLKERLQEKVLQEERCQSAARQTASKGQAELHLLGRAWGGKQKRRLLERQWKAQGLTAVPGTCELPSCTTEIPAEGTLVITAATIVSRRPSSKGECAK